jgi:hypothetical protein
VGLGSFPLDHETHLTWPDCPALKYPAFGVWLGSVSLTPLSPSSALPPVLLQDASPKAISGRTSYLQVRLAFHLYTQVIPQFCSIGGFGPPRDVTHASPCPCVAHSGFVSNACHSTIFRLLCALFRLAFASPSTVSVLSSPQTLTRWLILQKARRQKIAPPPTGCKHTVSDSISLPSPGFFSPFPHGTTPLSVIKCI